MASLLLWLASLFFVVALTVVCGIVCLCVKGQQRSIAINVLLVLGTLVVLLNLGASLLPKEALTTKATKELKSEYIHKADLDSYSILYAVYSDGLAEPLKTIAAVDETKSVTATLKETEKELRKLLADHPASTALTSRLAILVHESGGDVQAVFNEYNKKGAQYANHALLSSLAKVYAVKSSEKPHDRLSMEDRLTAAESSKPDDSQQAMADRLSAGTSSRADDSESALSIIEKRLPAGWYRETALIDALKDSPARLASVKATREQRYVQWTTRYALYLLARAVLFCGALWGLYSLVRNDFLPPPANLSFSLQKVYGCLLSVLYAQTVVGVFIGLAIGIFASLMHEPLSNFRIIITEFVLIGGTVGAALAVYFFVLRPDKISLWHLISGQAVRMSHRQVAKTCFQGFCLMFLANFIVSTIMRFLPAAPHFQSELSNELADAVILQKTWLLLSMSFLICALAPITEEILFRGLLYQWLRKSGVALAVLISAAAFALWHMDLPGFFQYFALGVVLAIYFEKTRNVAVTACIHALWNAWIVVGLLWLIPTY